MSHGGLLSRQDGLTAQGLRGGDNGDYRGRHIDRVDTDNDTKYDNTKKRGPTGIRRIPLTSRSGECQRGLANTHAHTYALLTMHALIHAPIPYARNSHTRQPEPALHTSQPTCHLCHVTLTCPRSSAHLPRFWTMSRQGQAPPSPPAQMARRAHARSFGSAVRPQPALHTTLLSTLLSRLTCPAPRTPGSLFLKRDRIIRTQTDLN